MKVSIKTIGDKLKYYTAIINAKDLASPKVTVAAGVISLLLLITVVLQVPNNPSEDQGLATSISPVVDKYSHSYVLLVEDSKKDFITLKSASAYVQLSMQSPICINAYGILSNGTTIALFKDATDAKLSLGKFIQSKVPSNITLNAKGYNEKVKVVSTQVMASEFNGFSTVSNALATMNAGVQNTIKYSVSERDTLSTIAKSHQITLEELEASNPGITTQKYLKVGQELNIQHQRPLLTAVAIGEVVMKEEVAPTDEYVSSNKLYLNETKLISEGKKEIRETRYTVKVVNNDVIDRTIIEKTLIQKMEPNKIAKGTKPVKVANTNTKIASNLGRPASNYVVYSRFGKRGSGFHTGIDLSMPSGSPVKAADAGTVVFSGNQGSYGLVITIDHGQGIKSLYSHNSKNLVSVGDIVKKGQLIAKSGQTGRATGPHLHFEVRKNNTPINPERFLNF